MVSLVASQSANLLNASLSNPTITNTSTRQLATRCTLTTTRTLTICIPQSDQARSHQRAESRTIRSTLATRAMTKSSCSSLMASTTHNSMRATLRSDTIQAVDQTRESSRQQVTRSSTRVVSVASQPLLSDQAILMWITRAPPWSMKSLTLASMM